MNACGDDNNPATLGCFNILLPNIIRSAFIFVGSVTVIMIIMAGIKFIMSGGDNKQIDSARKTLTYAIIGLSIVVFSYLIINLVAYVTGAKCIANFSSFGFTTCQ